MERLAWFDARPDTAHWIARNALHRMAIDDEPLTQEIASFGWVVDGITVEEAGALDDLSWLIREYPAIADTVLVLPWMATDAVITPDGRRALRAIRAAAVADENTGVTLAGYEWLADGLTQHEATALETIGEIVAPGFTTQTATGIGAIRLDRAGIGEPPSVSPRSLERATTFSQFSWMQDDVTVLEAGLITGLNRLTETAGSLHADAADIVVSYGWVQDGVARQEPASLARYQHLFEAAGAEDADALPIMLEYEWVADKLLSDEIRSIGRLTSLLEASSSDDAGVLRTMVNYPWLADSIDNSEYVLLTEFPGFLRLEEAQGAGYRQTVLDYDWLADDVTSQKTAAFRFMADSIDLFSPEQPDALDTLLAYEWLQDDIREAEINSIRTLEEITQRYSADSDEFIVALIASPWMQDGVKEEEDALLRRYRDYLHYWHTPGVAMPSRLATYPWLDDGVSDTEIGYVLAALDLLSEIAPTAPETIKAVIENSSADPASIEGVMTAFQNLRWTFYESGLVYDGALTAELLDMPWLLDGIERSEGWWMSEYTWLLREFDGEHEELARSVLARPWARDDITRNEIEWTHQYRRLLEETTGKTRENSLELADLDWFQEQIDALAASIMGRLALSALNDDPLITEIIDADWAGDGINESNLILLVALLDAQARSQYQYEDLLRKNNIAQRTLNLPLAGDVELYVVRHTKFPDDDPTLDLMEQIAVQLEDFMGVPFPRNPAIVQIMEPSTRAGEEPLWYVAYATSSHIVASAPRYNPGFHLAIFHEMSHLYWGGHTGAPGWWTEGAAGFLPDIARDVLGHEALEERHHDLLWDTRNECWFQGIANISRYYHLQETEPAVARDRGICVYAFGEVFLIEMYLLLGRDATSAAMRQIYVDARDSGWFNHITDQQIYDAFRANTPDDKVEDFRKLFMRLHGGARVDLSEPNA